MASNACRLENCDVGDDDDGNGIVILLRQCIYYKKPTFVVLQDKLDLHAYIRE